MCYNVFAVNPTDESSAEGGGESFYRGLYSVVYGESGYEPGKQVVRTA